MTSVTELFPGSDDGNSKPPPDNEVALGYLADVAQVWSGIMGINISPTDVALMLAGADLVMARREPEVPEHVRDVKAFAAAAEDLLS